MTGCHGATAIASAVCEVVATIAFFNVACAIDSTEEKHIDIITLQVSM
jgi:hypothetical protein